MRNWATWKALPAKAFTSYRSTANSNLAWSRKRAGEVSPPAGLFAATCSLQEQAAERRHHSHASGGGYEKPDRKRLSSPGIYLLNPPEVRWADCFAQQFSRSRTISPHFASSPHGPLRAVAAAGSVTSPSRAIQQPQTPGGDIPVQHPHFLTRVLRRGPVRLPPCWPLTGAVAVEGGYVEPGRRPA